MRVRTFPDGIYAWCVRDHRWVSAEWHRQNHGPGPRIRTLPSRIQPAPPRPHRRPPAVLPRESLADFVERIHAASERAYGNQIRDSLNGGGR